MRPLYSILSFRYVWSLYTCSIFLTVSKVSYSQSGVVYRHERTRARFSSEVTKCIKRVISTLLDRQTRAGQPVSKLKKRSYSCVCGSTWRHVIPSGALCGILHHKHSRARARTRNSQQWNEVNNLFASRVPHTDAFESPQPKYWFATSNTISEASERKPAANIRFILCVCAYCLYN